MPVLPDEEALEEGWQRLSKWFRADGYAPAVVLIGVWVILKERVTTVLEPRDLYILETSRQTIAIEDVRHMTHASVSTTPFGKRLIIIPDCERLSLPAAQALLKFLEEPAAGNRVLLTTPFPKRLLPTIRSRIEVLRLKLKRGEKVEERETHIDAVQLLTAKNRRPLTDEELKRIAIMIENRFKSGGQLGPIYRALLRLRDYYKIRGTGGNEKLAADVLLASVLELGQETR